jgi:phenylpyruvate tautomerase PptA (4-oxalocrotonate tautomerase family)
MPTYTITAPTGRLTTEQKSRLAEGVTRAHQQQTGAQGFFAQVVFVEVAASDWFVGGAPIEGDQLFIHGQIRAGRSADVKRALLMQLIDTVAAVCAAPNNKVWGYLVELPAAQMAEYGHVLPEPGGEGAWLAALPSEDRELMQSIGR